MRLRGGLAAGVLCVAVALVGVSGCSAPAGPPPPPPPPPGAAATPGATSGSAGASSGDQQTVLTQGYQRALALTQFGGLGGAQGVGDQVKALGPEVEQQGKDLEGRIKALAEAQQVSLSDQLASADQSMLTQLKAQTGAPFDAAWLTAAQQAAQQAKDWANGVLNDPSASPDAQGGARDLVAKLDALAPKLQAAAASGGTGSAGSGTGNGAGGTGAGGNGAGGNSASGAGSGSGSGSGNAPRSVDSGTGGQAATDGGIVLPGALIGLGIVLLGMAGFWLRRSPRS